MAQRYERELVIEQRDPNELLAHPQNYRAHPAEQIEEIAKSLRALGQYRNVVARPDGTLLAGHGVVEAARKVGMATVAVHIFEGTAEQEHLLMVADNELSRKAVDDEHALHGLLKQLQQEWGDLGGTGWDDDEHEQRLAELAAEDFEGGLAQEDPGAGEVPEEPQTRLGDVWLCGEHRVVCGDCTEAGVVDAAMQGRKALLFATDPPYGCDAGNIGFTAQRDDIEAITKDDLTGEAMQDFLETVFAAALPHLHDRAAWYLWHPMLTQGYFAAAAAAAAADIIIHRQIIWVKEQFIFGRGDYHWRHELCFYGWRRGHRPEFYGERNQHTIWEVPWGERRSEVGHPTAKPPELFARPMRNHLRRGELAFEPFLGSGSQLLAAEMEGMVCAACELEPRYVDVAVRRWAQATGRVPVLEADGTEFEV